MLFTKKRYEIDYQIAEFLQHRKRRVGTTKDHHRHLHQFAKITGVTDAQDISEYDIRAYIEALVDKNGRGYEFIEAQTAFRLFYNYTKQKRYLSEYTHKTHNWDISVRDRYQQRHLLPLETQLKDDILKLSTMNTKKKSGGRPKNETLKNEIIEKQKEGWSIRKIGKYYNRAPSTIHEIVNGRS